MMYPLTCDASRSYHALWQGAKRDLGIERKKVAELESKVERLVATVNSMQSALNTIGVITEYQMATRGQSAQNEES